jgi:hypothetical protein
MLSVNKRHVVVMDEGDDSPEFNPASVVDFIKSVAGSASCTYSFSLKHRSETEEENRDVKMSGTTQLVFPMDYHDLALALPNSKFESAGATWTKALARPTFTSNRTQPTVIQGSEGTVEMPVHTFTMSPDANCSLEIKNIDLSAAGGVDLHANASLLYAREIHKRFQWIATERSGSSIRFALARTIPDGIKPVDESILNARSMIPRSILLEHLNYDVISSPGLRTWLRAWLEEIGKRNPLERNMYDVSVAYTDEQLAEIQKTNPGYTQPTPPTPLPSPNGEGHMWDDAGVKSILKTRVEKWNKLARDQSERPMFRPTVKKQTERPSTLPQQDDKAVQHTFFRPVGDRFKSQLMKCEIKVFEYKVATATELTKLAIDKNPKDVSPSDFVDILNSLTSSIPDSDRIGIRNPLIQRFRVVMGSREARGLLKLAFEADKDKNPERAFANLVARCAGFRVLYTLAEITTLVYQLDKAVMEEDMARNPTLDWVVRKGKAGRARLELVYNRLLSAIAPYSTFYNQMKEWETWDADNREWVLYGDTKPPVSVSISITAHGFGEGVNTLSGASPSVMEHFKPALNACLSRLIFDPDEIGMQQIPAP